MEMKSSPDRELFGTLIASTPVHTRSWKSLAIAVALHVVLIAAAIVTFKPFALDNDSDDTPIINMIVVQEEDAVTSLPNPFVRATEQIAAVTPPRKPEEELVMRAGPLVPIVVQPGSSAPALTETDEETDVPRGQGGSLSSRLLPQNMDPRISTTTAFPPATKTGAEAVRARISDRLAVWNDSIAAEAEAARRADDWTLKGKDGNRWGVSREGIHIGKVTIPASALAFKPPAGRREEIAGRLRDFAEIESQVYREESRSSFKERVQAIRERKDRERAERKKAAPEEKPITESR